MSLSVAVPAGCLEHLADTNVFVFCICLWIYTFHLSVWKLYLWEPYFLSNLTTLLYVTWHLVCWVIQYVLHHPPTHWFTEVSGKVYSQTSKHVTEHLVLDRRKRVEYKNKVCTTDNVLMNIYYIHLPCFGLQFLFRHLNKCQYKP